MLTNSPDKLFECMSSGVERSALNLWLLKEQKNNRRQPAALRIPQQITRDKFWSNYVQYLNSSYPPTSPSSVSLSPPPPLMMIIIIIMTSKIIFFSWERMN